MEDDVDAVRQAADEVTVADVALDELDGAVGARPIEVLAAAADEVVEHHDLLGAADHQLVDDVGADGATATGDEDPAQAAHCAAPARKELRSWTMPTQRGAAARSCVRKSPP